MSIFVVGWAVCQLLVTAVAVTAAVAAVVAPVSSCEISKQSELLCEDHLVGLAVVAVVVAAGIGDIVAIERLPEEELFENVVRMYMCELKEALSTPLCCLPPSSSLIRCSLFYLHSSHPLHNNHNSDRCVCPSERHTDGYCSFCALC